MIRHPRNRSRQADTTNRLSILPSREDPRACPCAPQAGSSHVDPRPTRVFGRAGAIGREKRARQRQDIWEKERSRPLRCRVAGSMGASPTANLPRPFSSFKRTNARAILSHLFPGKLLVSTRCACMRGPCSARFFRLHPIRFHTLRAGMRVSPPESRELLYTLRVQTLPDNSTRSAYEFFHRAHGSEVLGSTWLYTHAGRPKHGSRRQYHLP